MGRGGYGGGGFDDWQHSTSLPDHVKAAAQASAEKKIAPEARCFVSDASGLRVHYRTVAPVGKLFASARGRIFFWHGLNDHANKLSVTVLARALVAKGFVVHMADMQGHGYSEGFAPRHIRSWTDLLADASQFVRMMLPKAPAAGSKLPFAFVAHSTGGALSVLLAHEFQDSQPLFRGLFLLAPLLQTPASPLIKVRTLLRCLTHLCCLTRSKAPIKRVTDRAPFKVFGHEEIMRAELSNDPLQWTTMFSYGTLLTLTLLSDAVQARAKELRCPLRIVHGAGDGLLPSGSSRDVALHSLYGKALAGGTGTGGTSATQPPIESFVPPKGCGPAGTFWLVEDSAHLPLSSPSGAAVMADCVAFCEWVVRQRPEAVFARKGGGGDDGGGAAGDAPERRV